VGLPDRRRQGVGEFMDEHMQHSFRSGSLHANHFLLVIAASFGLVVLGVWHDRVADRCSKVDKDGVGAYGCVAGDLA
jgi:hypothetical protein